jgi:hypothetical protein
MLPAFVVRSAERDGLVEAFKAAHVRGFEQGR